MKRINLTNRLHLQAADGGKQRRFRILAYTGGTLPVDGFPVPVVVDLSGLEVPGNIPILIDHTKSVEATLGITDSITNDGQQLVLTGIVTGASAMVQSVLAADANGQQWQASIGAMAIETEEIAAGQTVAVNGQVISGPVIVARRAALRETSVLPMGADAGTQVNLAASAALKSGVQKMTMEEWVKSLGMEMSSLTPEALAALQKAYDAKTAAPAPMANAAAEQPAAVPQIPAPAAAAAVVDITAALRTQAAAETRRIAEIQAAASGFPAIAATAIEAGWSRDKVELEVLKAQNARTRPTSFSASQNQPENMPQVLQAAVSLHRGHKDIEKMYDDRTLQAAHSQFRRGIGLQQLFLQAAAANGRPISAGERITHGNLRDVLAYACGGSGMVQAGFSTVSLPGILSNVANKELLDGYMEEDAAWREIAAIKSVSDFKTVTSYRMLDEMEYDEIGPAGEIKHGTTGQESYTRQAKTYARMYAVTRTDIINDDLGAFDDLRNRVGRGAAKKLNKVFWTLFVNNSSFFTSGRTNYISGSTTNLGADGVGLGLGVKAFRQMKSPSADGQKQVNGNGGRPSILLVPPSLEVAAEQLFQSTNITTQKASEANIFARKYRPVVAWQLEDSAYTGYSATAWYLLADPGYLATVNVSFLNGQQTPTVESADADFNTLGIQFRGYHDFGVDFAEYLGGVKSKGAA